MCGRLRSVDVIRGLAASIVVLHHAGSGFTLGRIGVDFFFVVSGFVIFHSANGRSAADFLTARAWRIFPIYWIAAAPWLLFSIMRGAMSTARLAEQSFLFPFWVKTNLPLLVVAWTLAFECLFYAATAIAIRIRTVVPLLALYSAAMLAWGWGLSQRLLWLGNPLILEFLMGVAIAMAPKDRRFGRVTLFAGLAWLLFFPNSSYSMEFRDFAAAWSRVLLWGIPAALIVYGAICFEDRFTGRTIDALCFVGGASYSIYLFHTLITEFTVGISWPLVFVSALALGVAAWAFFEQPLMRYRPPLGWWQRLLPINPTADEA